MSWLSEKFERWRPKSLREYLGRQGAMLFIVGVLIYLYTILTEGFVVFWFPLGMMVAGLIMVVLSMDEEDWEEMKENYHRKD